MLALPFEPEGIEKTCCFGTMFSNMSSGFPTKKSPKTMAQQRGVPLASGDAGISQEPLTLAIAHFGFFLQLADVLAQKFDFLFLHLHLQLQLLHLALGHQSSCLIATNMVYPCVAAKWDGCTGETYIERERVKLYSSNPQSAWFGMFFAHIP